MNARGFCLTDGLLVVVIILIAASFAVPDTQPEERTPPRESMAGDAMLVLARFERKLDEAVAEMRHFGYAPVVAPGAEASSEDVVVRIPARLVDELGITASDVRALLRGLALATKDMGVRRKHSNETAAIATLRNLGSAQAQFQATAKADVDRDGTGEFGAFRELSGAIPVRQMKEVGRLNPPVLSGAFRNPTSGGFVSRSGYHFVIYLPDASGGGVPADRDGTYAVDSDLAETTWCGYAWPAEQGESGRRTFMVNQTGDIVATEAREYAGTNAPRPGAAFKDGGSHRVTGLTAVGVKGQDGNLWKQVN